MSDPNDISREELERRVIYSLLVPTVRLARRFGMPLKELTSWIETAYFHEIRAGGATLKEAGEQLGVSQRTTVRLAKQLRESFFLPEFEHNLPRRIEFMLAAQAMSEARLQQVLPSVPTERVSEALSALVAAGRVVEVRGRTRMFETRAASRRLPRDTWMSRIGALNSLLENVANTTWGRFFRDEPRAFARTLTFQVRAEDVAQLAALYERHVLPFLTELSERAGPEDEQEHAEMQVSIVWAPYEYIDRDAAASAEAAAGDEPEGDAP